MRRMNESNVYEDTIHVEFMKVVSSKVDLG